MHARHRIILKYGSIAIILALTGLQLIPTGFNLDPPPVKQEPSWDSTATRALVQRACYDCHAYETDWPWYSRIAPFSWMLQHDIQAGLEALNFSDWEQATWTEEDLDELIETVAKEQMPLPYYTILNPEARLTERERGQIINGMIATTTELEQPGRVIQEEGPLEPLDTPKR